MLYQFNAEMLPCTFKEQGKKWPFMAYAHVSNAVLIVHHFIRQTLEECCPDVVVREELWAFLLYGNDGHDGLVKRYARAMEHVDFLLSVEFETRTITYDIRFEEKFNQLKLNEQKPGPEQGDDTQPEKQPKSSLEETGMTIHNALHAYYDLARSRFVDVVCQQAIDYYLLHANNGPLTVLSDNVVLNMTAEQLEIIAGEDLAVREKRERLTKEIDSLSQALKILRG